ncbi:hypothetical protein KIL84_017732 [Mauremys mutica]|uniref:Uncharacterized protein n=1 Tax=Mauremys mutica TaxID=74926 RepID=A0A9D4AX60_9SAUR|nr:hypothetical protein KIL84_017732 [Mauremys mutica]
MVPDFKRVSILFMTFYSTWKIHRGSALLPPRRRRSLRRGPQPSYMAKTSSPQSHFTQADSSSDSVPISITENTLLGSIYHSLWNCYQSARADELLITLLKHYGLG